MANHPDAVDDIRDQLGQLYPNLDTSALGVTGRILRLARTFERRRAEHLADFDLAPGDFDVLATIRRTQGEEGIKPRQLLQSVLITSGGLTKRLDRLEASGWLARYPDPDDRRGTRVRLTSEGSAHIDRAIPSVLTMEHQLLAEAASQRQLDQTVALLRQLMVIPPR